MFFEKRENPFLIDVADQDEYSHDDYKIIQQKLSEKNIDSFLSSLYPDTPIKISYEEMYNRVTRCLRQTLIEDDKSPTKTLYKVGSGGDCCIVTCAPLSDIRSDLADSILTSLEKVGWNGYFYLMKGGFPNPTGIEMKYAGVPYSFKIFMMLEAEKIGFEKVLWIDAACYAHRDPTPLFEHLTKNDVVFTTFPANYFEENSFENIIFPKTLSLLCDLVGRDVRNDTTINSIVFGLNLESPLIAKLVCEYYEMVYLSCPIFQKKSYSMYCSIRNSTNIFLTKQENFIFMLMKIILTTIVTILCIKAGIINALPRVIILLF